MAQDGLGRAASVSTTDSRVAASHKSSRRPSELEHAKAQPTPPGELFPRISARIGQTDLMATTHREARRTPDNLLQNMLAVIFGWTRDVRSLIRDEQTHQKDAALQLLLAKWLKDDAEDQLRSMKEAGGAVHALGWIVIALASIGSQKKVGQIFVERLLEQGSVHPAVAVLMELGELNDAIEVYVSRKMWMEAILLTALTSPHDWHRIKFLVKRWGSTEQSRGNTTFALRCRSCATSQPSDPWFSPRAKDAAYAAQQERLMGPDPQDTDYFAGLASVPSSSKANRPGLKLVTTFAQEENPQDEHNGATSAQPIIVTAISSSPRLLSASLSKAKIPWQKRMELYSAEPITAIDQKRLAQLQPLKGERRGASTPISPAPTMEPRIRSRLKRQPPLVESAECGSTVALNTRREARPKPEIQFAVRSPIDRVRRAHGHSPRETMSRRVGFEPRVVSPLAPSMSDSDSTWETIFSLESLTNSDLSSLVSPDQDEKANDTDTTDHTAGQQHTDVPDRRQQPSTSARSVASLTQSITSPVEGRVGFAASPMLTSPHDSAVSNRWPKGNLTIITEQIRPPLPHSVDPRGVDALNRARGQEQERSANMEPPSPSLPLLASTKYALPTSSQRPIHRSSQVVKDLLSRRDKGMKAMASTSDLLRRARREDISDPLARMFDMDNHRHKAATSDAAVTDALQRKAAGTATISPAESYYRLPASRAT